MQQVHFCRCHVCGEVNSNAVGHTMKCQSCRKPLARFYYFDDQLTPIYSDKNFRPEHLPIEVKPIYGLTAYWES